MNAQNRTLPPSIRWLLCLLAALASGACIYRIDIQQGNLLDETAVSQLEVGMTRSQVRFLLGTPMVEDAFNDERWDYVYYFRPGRRGEPVSRRVTVYFEGESVTRIERADLEMES